MTSCTMNEELKKSDALSTVSEVPIQEGSIESNSSNSETLDSCAPTIFIGHRVNRAFSLDENAKLGNGKPIQQSSSLSMAMNQVGASDTKSIDDFTVPKQLRSSLSSYFNKAVHLNVKNESKVLVLYTGGTIGMVRNIDGVLAPQSNVMESKIRGISTMHDDSYAKVRFGEYQASDKDVVPLVLPNVPDHKRVVYTIYEYDPLLDSSNMTMDDWILIAKDIRRCYHIFDGFVILHGTDTMAYTASALSYMLENLGKTVIITGAQIPCFETRSDGRENLVGALILAGNFCIPEVSVFFNQKLLRGNRTIKVSSGNLHAFDSPNNLPLASVGIDIHVHFRRMWKPTKVAAMHVHERLCPNVVLLRLFPSIRTETVQHFLAPPIQGVVLQCYGAGNMPSNRQDILDLLAMATAVGVIIVTCTQCTHGAVSGLYQTGKALIDAGIIPGSDITPEAALTKLSYVLSKDEWTQEKKRQMMKISIRGEMTVQFEEVNPKTLELEHNDNKTLDLIEQVSRAMNLSSGEEIAKMKEILFPSLICSAVYLGDVEKLKSLVAYEADFSAGDYDQRTPLHVAASEGSLEVVKWLLNHGATVHARDRNEETPLMSAVNAGHEDVINMLVKCGAHLSDAPVARDQLLVASTQGRTSLVKCLLAAGTNVDMISMANGNTGLHAAVEADQGEVIRLLLESGASTEIKNMYGLTPRDIAQKLGRTRLLKVYKL